MNFYPILCKQVQQMLDYHKRYEQGLLAGTGGRQNKHAPIYGGVSVVAGDPLVRRRYISYMLVS